MRQATIGENNNGLLTFHKSHMLPDIQKLPQEKKAGCPFDQVYLCMDNPGSSEVYNLPECILLDHQENHMVCALYQSFRLPDWQKI
jgi:hypothetical protein